MASLVLIGVVTTLVAAEPPQSAKAEATLGRENVLRRLYDAAVGAFTEFFSYDLAFVALLFVVLFKLTDALSGVMTAPFVIDLGFSRNEYAAIIKGVGFAATLLGGFAGGFLARALTLPVSLLIGAVVQGLANLGFSWQAVLGHNIEWLTVAIVLENFTSAVATVVFVAYLSALCRNPLHTATQYALLTALAAVGRTYLSAGAGYIVNGFAGFPGVGWAWFFAICAVAGVPALLLLAFLQHRGHFDGLLPAQKERRQPTVNSCGIVAANHDFGIVAARLWRKRNGRPILGFGGPFAGAKKSFCKDQIAIIPVVLSSVIPKRRPVFGKDHAQTVPRTRLPP